MPKLDVLRQEFPRLRRALDFGEFHADLAGNFVDVWLNPSVEWRDRLREIHRSRVCSSLTRLTPAGSLGESCSRPTW